MASWQGHVIKFALRTWQSRGYKSRSIQKERAALEARVAWIPKKRNVKYETCEVEGLHAEWITAPGASAERVILYLHGGAYIVGSINTHRLVATNLSRVTQARVLIVEYRLAPEYPFPRGFLQKAWRWLGIQREVD